MEVVEFNIEGVKLLKPKVFGDARGYFLETYQKENYNSILGVEDFIQDNESKSKRGVLRGLHFQKPPYAQAKLVRCIVGKVIDVAVDLRKASPTYGQHVAVELSEENKHAFFVPRGFAHGFVVLSETAIFSYKVDNKYAPDTEGGILYNSPGLDINWGINEEDLLLSDKDKVQPLFSSYESPF